MRKRAIFYCLWYGILPWWCYEQQRHYTCSWGEHLLINLRYAWRWLTFQEDESDVKFEQEFNAHNRVYPMITFIVLGCFVCFLLWHGFNIEIGKPDATFHAEAGIPTLRRFFY